MPYIDPETAAHSIAKIFCSHNYGKILSNACKTYKMDGKGDPDVAAAKKLADLYFEVYDTVYESALRENESLKDSE